MAWSGNTDRLEVLAMEEDGAGMTVKIGVSGGKYGLETSNVSLGKTTEHKNTTITQDEKKMIQTRYRVPTQKNIEFCFSIIRDLP